jgi:hypothetical protein
MHGALAQLVEGRFEGAGAETYPGGGVYTGGFAGGRRSGAGACHFGNGDFFEGEWAAGLRHGRGMQQCTDDSTFVRPPTLTPPGSPVSAVFACNAHAARLHAVQLSSR